MSGDRRPPAPSTVGFLDALFAGLPAGLWLAFTAVEPGADWDDRERCEHRFMPASDLDAAAAWCSSWGRRRNVYARCMPMRQRPSGGRGGGRMSAALVGLWADVDFDAPGHKRNEDGRPLPPTVNDCERIIAAVGVRPSLVLHTGGGLQAWWLLDEPIVADDDELRQRITAAPKRWQETIQRHAWILGGGTDEDPGKGWHVDSTGDPARVLRVSGTWRSKLDGLDPVRVTVHDVGDWPDGTAYVRPWRPGPRYTLAELEDRFLDPPPPIPAVNGTSTSVDTGKARRAAPVRTGGDYGPADAFAELSWAEILAPLGWIHQKTVIVDGATVELWQRPGGSTPVSLKAWSDAAVCWSGNAGLPVGVGMSKFQLWCHLHRVDARTAARLVRAEADKLRKVKR